MINRKNKIILLSIFTIFIIGGGLFFYILNTFFNPNWEIVDKLDRNIFPSVILSSATTEKNVVQHPDSNMLGNPKSAFAIRIKNVKRNSTIRIVISETPFFDKTVTEIILPKSDYSYLVYPDMLWKYDKLRNNKQAQPIDVSVEVQLNGNDLSYKRRTFSVRSVNECLLGYMDKKRNYHSTSIFFAAYVNEEHPIIDKVLKDALDTRIIKRFVGYQTHNPQMVKRQVYAIWDALQKRGFKYSSLTNTSIASHIVYTQRVRTLDDSFESLQLNCVDGSVLFASVLKAIDIDPILVRIPGHMFVGFYLERHHKRRVFLETTMLDNVDIDDYFSKKKLETINCLLKDNVSLATFNCAMEYANKKFLENKNNFDGKNPNFMYLEINNDVRRFVQPIGK